MTELTGGNVKNAAGVEERKAQRSSPLQRKKKERA